MNNWMKRSVSLFMSAAMSVALVPSIAFASESSGGGSSSPIAAEYASFQNEDGSVEKSTDVKYKWVQYEDDETGQVGWGQVEIATATVGEVTYYFVTDPDPKHVNEVTCSYVDYPSSAENICLNIPEHIKLDGVVYTTTAIGNVHGSKYLAPGSEENIDLDGNEETSLEVDKQMVSYWYGSSVQGFPRWFMYQAYPDDKTYANAAQLKPRHKNTVQDCAVDGEFAKYVSQHPFVDGYGSNDSIFNSEYGGMYTKDDQGNWNFWYKTYAVVEVVIPETVRSLGGSAFRGCENLSKVTFAGDSQLTSMGHQAFENTALTSLELPDGLEAISSITYYRHRDFATDKGFGSDYRHAEERGWGRYVSVDDSATDFTEETYLDSTNFTTKDKAIEAKESTSGFKEYGYRNGLGRFAGLDKLETLSIGGGTDLKQSGNAAKGIAIDSSYLPSLKSLVIRGENKDFACEDGLLYLKDLSKLVYVPAKIENVTIACNFGIEGKTMNSIFTGNTSIKSVTLKEGVTRIENAAFSKCSSLSEVTIPESIEFIGMNAFANTKLHWDNFHFPDKVSKLALNAFTSRVGTADAPGEIISGYSSEEKGSEVSLFMNAGAYVDTYRFLGDFTTLNLNEDIKVLNPQATKSNYYNTTFGSSSAHVASFSVYLQGNVQTISVVESKDPIKAYIGYKTDPAPTTLTFYGHKDSLADYGLTTDYGDSVKYVKLKSADEVSALTVDAVADQTYTGSAVTPSVVVKDGGTELVAGTDYRVSYENNVNVGTATATIIGKGQYAMLEKTVEFAITPKQIPSAEAISEQTYTGSAVEPAVAVMDGDSELVAGMDYTVSYANNVKPGTAKATVTGIGNYAGTEIVTFDIAASAEDTKAASAVDDAIAALPAAGSITLTDKAAIEAAYASFEKLTDAQKLLVDNGTKLLSAMKAVDALQSADLQKQIDALKAQLADAKAQAVTSVTVNAKTVTASAVAKAISKAGGKAKYVTSITLGSKVKTIKKGAFKACKKVKTITVKTKKLTKKSVKGAFKGSKVKTVKVPKKCVKKYKKFMTKKVVGKKVAVTK